MSKHSFKNHFIYVVNNIYKHKYNFENNLDQLHLLLNSNKLSESDKQYNNSIQILGVNDRQSIFLNDYHTFVDQNDSFNKVYYSFINDNIKPLFPEEEKLVIQKTPNLRISFPELTAIGRRENEDVEKDIIGLHKDSDFGHHREEVNFIIPLTEMFDSNSVYYEPEADCNIPFDGYINLRLNTEQFFTAKLNKLRHFNRVNKTGKTRMSLDLRIIPYSKYMQNITDFEGTKFELGKYYKVI